MAGPGQAPPDNVPDGTLSRREIIQDVPAPRLGDCVEGVGRRRRTGISTSYSHHGMCQADPDARADVSSRTKSRCSWAGEDPLMQAYHDEGVGRSSARPRALWEMLMLEGFQAGLSWAIVRSQACGISTGVQRLRSRCCRPVHQPGHRTTPRELRAIIQARAKIEATIAGARVFREMRDRGEHFGDIAGRSPKGK
mgnify:CR=1 FL=1